MFEKYKKYIVHVLQLAKKANYNIDRLEFKQIIIDYPQTKKCYSGVISDEVRTYCSSIFILFTYFH